MTPLTYQRRHEDPKQDQTLQRVLQHSQRQADRTQPMLLRAAILAEMDLLKNQAADQYLAETKLKRELVQNLLAQDSIQQRLAELRSKLLATAPSAQTGKD